jgi:carboxyl-terminal processing protease
MKDKINKIFKKFFPKKKKKIKFDIIEVLVLVFTTMILSVVMGSYLSYKFIGPRNDYSKDLERFIKNYNYIIDNYYGDIDEKVLLDGAIEGVLEALGDPFSSYIDPDNDNLELYLDGSFKGIGVEIINNQDSNILIKKVFSDSPAYKAGIKAGDVVLSVNDVDFTNKTPEELSLYIKSNNGPFTVRIRREAEEKIFILNKGLVIIESVTSKTFEINGKKIGMIKVDVFSATTYSQFRKKLIELEKEKIDSLIIDLRDNGGGHLGVVRDMVSLFLNKKHIIYQTEDKQEIKKYFSSGNIDKKYPIVLLSNVNSASASELMMAALRDNLNAQIIGERSFGKGTIQELQTLTDGNQIKLTIKKWLTPKGVWIHGKGLEPDIKISLDSKYYQEPIENNDTQLQKALEELSK